VRKSIVIFFVSKLTIKIHGPIILRQCVVKVGICLMHLLFRVV